MTSASINAPEIGVFDSGVGGLTVLCELHRLLPDACLRYVADTAHAPYGERSPEEIRVLSVDVVEWLVARGARLVVVACNTATAHAIDALRERWPDLPFVGTEPGIKPAVALTRNGRIGVLTTPATAASERYRSLVSRHAGSTTVISQPCPGLADLIEAGALDGPAIQSAISQACKPLRAAGVDTVLLGCTHYPLVQSLIQSALGPNVKLLNIETAVARRAAELWRSLPTSVVQATPAIHLHASGPSESLSRVAQALFGRSYPVVSGPASDVRAVLGAQDGT